MEKNDKRLSFDDKLLIEIIKRIKAKTEEDRKRIKESEDKLSLREDVE